MPLTWQNCGAILQVFSRKNVFNRYGVGKHVCGILLPLRRQKTVVFQIYEDVIQLDDNVNDYGISPLAYVLFNCGE